MTLVARFLARAEAEGAKIALVTGSGERIRFDALAQRSGALAEGWRRRGIGAGTRVLIAMPVGIDLYAAIAGLWRLGAVIVFPEPSTGLAGLRNAIEQAKPDAMLTAGFYRLLRLHPMTRSIRRQIGLDDSITGDPIAQLPPRHTALISFTSGSTGIPKGILRSHDFLTAQDAVLSPLLAAHRENEIDLVAFPVFALANLGRGITSVLPNWRIGKPETAHRKRVADLATQEKITRAMVPPSVCEALTKPGPALSLHRIFAGGGPIFPDLLTRLEAHYPNTTVTCVYGSTEAEPIAHIEAHDITPEQHLAMRSGAGLLVGKPVQEIDVSIRKGEILVAGEHVNRGYLDPASDAETKVCDPSGKIWHRTGDAGYLDDNGCLWLRGRIAGRAGTIFPFDVEVSARQWPGVLHTALLPGSDPPTLCLAGDELQLGLWDDEAGRLGLHVRRVRRIPFDSRHSSKVDYSKLKSS